MTRRVDSCPDFLPSVSRRGVLGALGGLGIAGVAELMGGGVRQAWAQMAASTKPLVLGNSPAPLPSSTVSSAHKLRLIDLHVEGNPRLGKRATVLVPTGGCTERLPVLVLLHGLGETHSELDGAYAWVQRYGLVSSYERLVSGAVHRLNDGRLGKEAKKLRFLTSARAQQLNAQLAVRPFRGMILVCPYTPNVFTMNTHRAVDEYGAWLVQVLLPEVRKRTPARTEARFTGIDGCSLGGYISLQVFQRQPTEFYTCGGVQSAFGKGSAAPYAERFAQIVQEFGPRPIHVQTSSQDPYHDANVLFSKQLTKRGVPHELCVPPGPHNQPWLIEVGTLEMLLWHERQLSALA